MKIQVLGTGCPRCRSLEESVYQAVKELGVDATIIATHSIDDVMKFGLMKAPGLVINDVVQTAGRLPSIIEIKALILNPKV